MNSLLLELKIGELVEVQPLMKGLSPEKMLLQPVEVLPNERVTCQASYFGVSLGAVVVTKEGSTWKSN